MLSRAEIFTGHINHFFDFKDVRRIFETIIRRVLILRCYIGCLSSHIEFAFIGGIILFGRELQFIFFDTIVSDGIEKGSFGIRVDVMEDVFDIWLYFFPLFVIKE